MSSLLIWFVGVGFDVPVIVRRAMLGFDYAFVDGVKKDDSVRGGGVVVGDDGDVDIGIAGRSGEL